MPPGEVPPAVAVLTNEVWLAAQLATFMVSNTAPLSPTGRSLLGASRLFAPVPLKVGLTMKSSEVSDITDTAQDAGKAVAGYRLDLLVENKVVVEIKAVESFTDIHMAQVLTYLKLSGCKTGLLLNFNVADMKKGIKRIII